MRTSFQPISKRRLAELEGYVAWPINLFRVVLFVAAVAGLTWLLRVVHDRLIPLPAQHALWWSAPAIVFAMALYRLAGRWTGGRALRAKIRADLAGGVAAVHRVVALDAIEVEEQEDEGPAFYLLTDDGRTMLFAGQYLDAYRRKGFPWREFDVLEAPASKIFFGIKPEGEKLTPSARRPPFTWDEYKRYRAGMHNYGFLDVPFEELRLAVPRGPV